MRKLYLICFDISSDKIRRKVVKQLENKGIRVQKSVFEAWLTDKQLVELRAACDRIIDQNSDSIRYYFLCKDCRSMIKISGYGVYTEADELIVF
jgi:CRISPR-associated protein Cas2